MIDIQKLIYIQKIAENDFNITKAAASLYISQPALSKTISTIESEEDLELFVRKKGRIVSFTPRGKKLYDESKILINYYNNMLENVKNDKGIKKENIRIAAPPILLSVYLSKLIALLNDEFPDVIFSYYEGNNIQIRDGLINKKYDLALMTKPCNYSLYSITEIPIDHSEFVAYVNINHPLKDKSLLTWKEITAYPLTLPGHNYSTYSLVWNAVKTASLDPQIILSNSLWDFQINVAINSNAISILPRFVKNMFNEEMNKSMKSIEIENPPPWEVCVCNYLKVKPSELIQKVSDFLVESFKNNNFLPSKN